MTADALFMAAAALWVAAVIAAFTGPLGAWPLAIAGTVVAVYAGLRAALGGDG